MAEFKYEITERIAVLSQSANGWERQLNMVSWNEREPKYDIRDWSPDGSKMGKGISLSHDEIAILKGILDVMELEAWISARSSSRFFLSMSPAPVPTNCWLGLTPPIFFVPRPAPVFTGPVRAGF